MKRDGAAVSSRTLAVQRLVPGPCTLVSRPLAFFSFAWEMCMMGLTKKTRFEVFKRDKFTCQYCGEKAPDVVLHVDHVQPKSKRGSDDPLNLVTTCMECNLGKGARELSDGSAIEKQRAQLDRLQERRNQLEMMLEWQRSLIDIEEEEVRRAGDFWCELSWWGGINAHGDKRLRGWIREYGMNVVLVAMRTAAVDYIERDDDGATIESTELAFNKVQGICYLTERADDGPHPEDAS